MTLRLDLRLKAPCCLFVAERSQSLTLLIFGLFWTATFVLILKTVLSQPNLFPVSVVGVFILIGLTLIGAGLLQLWTDFKLSPAELILPAYPLRLARRYGSFPQAIETGFAE